MTFAIEWIIPLALGLLLIIVFLVKSQRSDMLKENGVEAEGVIFDVESTSSSVDSTPSSNYYPVVRFVTKDGTWITKKSEESGFMIEQGQKVKLKYNPENPEDFAIISGEFKWNSYILLIAGLLSFAFGVYKLLDHVSL